jgi:hypothetical protein
MFRDDGSVQYSLARVDRHGQPTLWSLLTEETVVHDTANAVASAPKPRRLETRRSAPIARSGGWIVTKLRRQETVAYDIEASYRRRPAQALPPQSPASRLDQYPGEEPDCSDDESPRLRYAREVSVRVREQRDPSLSAWPDGASDISPTCWSDDASLQDEDFSTISDSCRSECVE